MPPLSKTIVLLVSFFISAYVTLLSYFDLKKKRYSKFLLSFFPDCLILQYQRQAATIASKLFDFRINQLGFLDSSIFLIFPCISNASRSCKCNLTMGIIFNFDKISSNRTQGDLYVRGDSINKSI